MLPDGSYVRRRGERPVLDSQKYFMRQSAKRKKHTKTKVNGI